MSGVPYDWGELLPDRVPESHPPSAAPVAGATRPEPLAWALIFAYGVLLLFIVSALGGVFGLW
jgi:hypothetical protein